MLQEIFEKKNEAKCCELGWQFVGRFHAEFLLA